MKDIAIIGGGPVGIFTTFQAGMIGLTSILIDNNPDFGGQCKALYPEKNIYDIPGFSKISAEDLIKNLELQSSIFSHKIENIKNTKISRISKNEDGFFDLLTTSGNLINAKSVILTTGAGSFEPNRIPIENAKDFEDHSLLYNVKDKSIFKDKKVVILGGGDSAVDWCNELSEIAAKIYIIHRRDTFTASIANFEKLKNIEIITPFNINKINGHGNQIESIVIVNSNDASERTIDCDFVLAFFGLKHENSMIRESGIVTKFNSIEVDQAMQTNIEGIFAAGDCVTYPNKLKLIMTGFSESAIACHCAYKFIHKKPAHFQHSTSIFS